MFEALIGAGISLIGGLFGRSDAKKKARKEEEAIRAANAANAEAAKKPVITEGSVDMKGFLAAAEQGGFNKLSMLRSGALGLFGRSMVWNSGAGGAAQMPVVSGVNVPGIGSIVADAAGVGFNAWQTEQNEQRRMNFQRELLGMQLAGQPNNGYRAGGYGVARDPGFRGFAPPSMKSSGSWLKGGGGELSVANGKNGLPTFKNPGDKLYMMGLPISTHAGTSNAEDAEKRLGDGPASWGWGILTGVADTGQTLWDYYKYTERQHGLNTFDSGGYSRAPTTTTFKPGLSALTPVIESGSRYIDQITATPTNQGKTWDQIYNENRPSWAPQW